MEKIKSLVNIGRFRKRNYDIKPDQDWIIIVSLFFVINLVLIIFLLLDYQDIKKHLQQTTTAENQELANINKDEVLKTLENYRQKRNRLEVISE